MGWTNLMDYLMGVLWERGITREQIESCMQSAQLQIGMKQVLKHLEAHHCDIKIISDSNTVFIDKVLEGSNVAYYFSDIFTNWAKFDEKGKLKVSPYHTHNCKDCPPNMCKGTILESILRTTNRRVIYFGDGRGDFCACTKLKKSDFIFARKDWALHNLLKQNEHKISAQVSTWENAEQAYKLFVTVINKHS